MSKSNDPLFYDAEKDKTLIPIPKDNVPIKPLGEIEAEVKRMELAGLIQSVDTKSLVQEDGSLLRPRSRVPTFEECEILGGLVAFGLTLEQACYLLTPPLKYEKVAKCFATNYKRNIIYQRAQSVWLYGALQQLLTRPGNEISGLIFILKNRHSKMFGASSKMKLEVDVTPLQLTSPEVIERARIYAQSQKDVIDVNSIELNSQQAIISQKDGLPVNPIDLPISSSNNSSIMTYIDKKTGIVKEFESEEHKENYQSYWSKKEEEDNQRSKEYLDNLINNKED